MELLIIVSMVEGSKRWGRSWGYGVYGRRLVGRLGINSSNSSSPGQSSVGRLGINSSDDEDDDYDDSKNNSSKLVIGRSSVIVRPHGRARSHG